MGTWAQRETATQQKKVARDNSGPIPTVLIHMDETTLGTLIFLNLLQLMYFSYTADNLRQRSVPRHPARRVHQSHHQAGAQGQAAGFADCCYCDDYYFWYTLHVVRRHAL